MQDYKKGGIIFSSYGKNGSIIGEGKNIRGNKMSPEVEKIKDFSLL